MKNKKIKIVMLSLLLLGIAYQGTLAVLHQSGNVDTIMSAGTLGIEIVGNKDKNSDSVKFESALPGSLLESQLKIENTKDKELYVRVVMTKYWTHNNGDKQVDANASYIHLITEQANDWYIVDNSESSNGEEVVFYYKKPITSKESTSFFLNAIQLSEDISDKAYANYHASLHIEANAIQKVGAKEAMLSEWGIEAEFNENGTIASIVE